MSGSAVYVDDDTENALREAERRLASFEKKAFGANRMARFRRESPRHPILVGMLLTSIGSLLLAVVGLCVLLAPLVIPDLDRTYAATPILVVIPPGLVGLAFCGGVLWFALRVLASARAGNSPLLPRQQSEFNRLQSDVQRLRASLEVNKRLSATPAPPRTRGSWS